MNLEISNVRVAVLNAAGAVIQTVLLSDYLEDSDLSEASVALLLDGERVFVTFPNPVFNHSLRVA